MDQNNPLRYFSSYYIALSSHVLLQLAEHFQSTTKQFFISRRSRI